MKVITLAKTKELLGITGTDSDAAIKAKIPFIDSKVKQITRQRYNLQIMGDTISGTPYIEVYGINVGSNRYRLNRSAGRFEDVSGINNPFTLDDLEEYLEIGTLIEGAGIPDDLYIEDVYYNGYSLELSGNTYSIPFIKLNADSTATGTGTQMFLGINIAYQELVALGIQYLISRTSTNLPENGLSARTIGPTSKSFSAVDQILDGKYGMPAWFVKGLPHFVGGR